MKPILTGEWDHIEGELLKTEIIARVTVQDFQQPPEIA